MKIKEITLQNYKRFVEPMTFPFYNKEDGEVNDITLIVGNNGTGKTTILQAIAAALNSIVRPYQNQKPSEFKALGYVWDTLQNGRMPLQCKMQLVFSDKEITATQKYAEKLTELYPERVYKVGNKKNLSFELDYINDKVKANSLLSINQAAGYYYATQLKKYEKDFTKLFDNVGTCLWYSEQRNSWTLATDIEDANGIFKKFELNELRQVLSAWYRFHSDKLRMNWTLKEGQRDFYEELEKYFKLLFPSRSFVGVIPKMDPSNLLAPPDFVLFDGKSQYELAEMSAGERAVFPILVDMANWNINNSIILIDEIELHLHPPLQQALVRALPKLGKNNQFIITTHSDDVTSMFKSNQIIRLK